MITQPTSLTQACAAPRRWEGSDLPLLEARFRAGTLVAPSPHALNFVDLARAVAVVAGAPDVAPSPGLAELAALLGQPQHFVFVLADGLGMNLVERLPAGAFLRRHLAAQLRAVFPSTTAVALTTLATGEWPGQHAITGWWTLLPELKEAATIVAFASRASGQPLAKHGITPEQAFPAPSLWSRFQRDTLALFPADIAHSVFSVYFTGGQPRHGYASLRQAIDLTLERARQASAPTFTYIYAPRLDQVAHLHGLNGAAMRGALAELDTELERLAVGLGGRGRLAVTADHGFLEAPPEAKHQLKATNSIAEWLRLPPSGDARVMYLHLKEGAAAPVRDYFDHRFGEQFLLLTIAEAEAAGLLGPAPLSAAARQRAGDLVAISTGAAALEWRAGDGLGRVMSEAAQHSGLTPEEMLIPLAVA